MLVVALGGVLAAGAGCSPEEARRKAAGNVRFKQGDFEGAIVEYRAAIAKNPKDANAHTLLGNALFEKERYDQAKASYDAALALDPKARAALQGLAMLHLRQQHPAEAKVLFEKLVAINARDSEAQAALGKLLFADKDLDGAERHLRQALVYAQNDSASMYTLGLVLAKKKDPVQAGVVFDRLEAVTPGKPYAPYGRAVAAALSGTAGSVDQGLDQLQRALERGIADLDGVDRDDSLSALRASPRYAPMMAAARARQSPKK